MTHVILALAFARAGHFLSLPPTTPPRKCERAEMIVQERPRDPPVVLGEKGRDGSPPGRSRYAQSATLARARTRRGGPQRDSPILIYYVTLDAYTTIEPDPRQFKLGFRGAESTVERQEDTRPRSYSIPTTSSHDSGTRAITQPRSASEWLLLLLRSPRHRRQLHSK